jgi:hypothetical protein
LLFLIDKSLVVRLAIQLSRSWCLF